MNIVKFLGAGGFDGEAEEASKVLTVGATYEVDDWIVHSWHTKLFLRDIEGTFNSAMFELVEGDVPGVNEPASDAGAATLELQSCDESETENEVRAVTVFEVKDTVYQHIRDMLISLNKDCPSVRHAQYELDAIGEKDADKDILAIISLFSMQGHSGFSAGWSNKVISKLLNFEPLCPLTGDDSEWVEVGTNVWQNRRAGNVFKEASTGAYQIDGYAIRQFGGSCYTNFQSRKTVNFPYTPSTEIVDVPFELEELEENLHHALVIPAGKESPEGTVIRVNAHSGASNKVHPIQAYHGIVSVYENEYVYESRKVSEAVSYVFNESDLKNI